MRYILLSAVLGLVFSGCKKDKFNSTPQIEYKKVSPNYIYANIPINSQVVPLLTLHVTDSEGDLGMVAGSDTSMIYLKNLLTGDEDSLLLPVLGSAATKNFEADIDVSLGQFIKGSTRPAPKTDTLYFEVYIKDFAKHKSNVIKTTDPVLFIFP